MKSLMQNRLAWPVIALAALVLLNQVFRPDFLSLRMQDGHLYGSIIDIMRNGAPTILIALGMTLVIATRGIDLSVGAVVAIAGAASCAYIAASRSLPRRLRQPWQFSSRCLRGFSWVHGTGSWSRRSVCSRSLRPWC